MTENFKADLHCHSTYSDGTYTPIELLELAKKNHLSGLSITDHDTVNAYDENFFLKAKQLDIAILVGVEISSIYEKTNVHILGYGIDHTNIEFVKFLDDVALKRKKRNMAILEKLKEKNIYITEEELYARAVEKKGFNYTNIGRIHIAQLMLEKKHVNSIQEAFDKYLKDDGPCYVAGEKYQVDQVIDKIHKNKGKAIIAHPMQINNNRILEKLFDYPFDGIEGYYSHLFYPQEKKWIDRAKEKGWIITGGSDFHGTVRPFVNLGASWVGYETFQKLKG